LPFAAEIIRLSRAFPIGSVPIYATVSEFFKGSDLLIPPSCLQAFPPVWRESCALFFSNRGPPPISQSRFSPGRRRSSRSARVFLQRASVVVAGLPHLCFEHHPPGHDRFCISRSKPKSLSFANFLGEKIPSLNFSGKIVPRCDGSDLGLPNFYPLFPQALTIFPPLPPLVTPFHPLASLKTVGAHLSPFEPVFLSPPRGTDMPTLDP